MKSVEMGTDPAQRGGEGDAALAARIARSVDALQDDAVALLSRLVREPSLLGEEAGAQAIMADSFAGLGLAVDRFAIDEAAIAGMAGYSPPVHAYDGRLNVVGVHRPRMVRGRSLILNGHIDVVPAGDPARWTSPPFSPESRDGRLYGRGAGDMKAGLVAYTMAFKALQALGYAPAAPVFLQSVIEEECTGNGALACLQRGYRADAAIIPEPFNHMLMTAQLGVMWAQITVFGRAAHMIDRGEGSSAIDMAFNVARHLTRLEAAWNAPDARHRRYIDHAHPINFNLGRIEGGEWTSSVPESCTMHWRLSFYPGQSLAAVRAAVQDTIDRAAAEDPTLAGCSVSIRWSGFQAEGFEADRDHPMMRLLADSHRVMCGSDIIDLSCTCTTDARFFALYGDTPATCYGPEASSIHTVDESVSLRSLRDVTCVLALFIAGWCGLETRV